MEPKAGLFLLVLVLLVAWLYWPTDKLAENPGYCEKQGQCMPSLCQNGCVNSVWQERNKGVQCPEERPAEPVKSCRCTSNACEPAGN